MDDEYFLHFSIPAPVHQHLYRLLSRNNALFTALRNYTHRLTYILISPYYSPQLDTDLAHIGYI